MTKFSNLKIGEKLSETTIYTVEKIKGNEVQLLTESGEHVVLDNKYIEGLLDSASQFNAEKEITRTEATQIFAASTNVVLTICYNKLVKAPDVLAELMNAYQNATPKTVEAEFKKSVKKALEGEERVLTGIHKNSTDEFGYIHIVDLEIAKGPAGAYDPRLRLVNSRTIKWIIVKGVKYTVKKK